MKIWNKILVVSELIGRILLGIFLPLPIFVICMTRCLFEAEIRGKLTDMLRSDQIGWKKFRYAARGIIFILFMWPAATLAMYLDAWLKKHQPAFWSALNDPLLAFSYALTWWAVMLTLFYIML